MLTDVKHLRQDFPLLNTLCTLQLFIWFNPASTSLAEGYSHLGLTREQDKVTG